MSIASEIQRLQTAKEDIVTALAAIGINIPSGTTLDEFAEIINPNPALMPLTFEITSPGVIRWGLVNTAGQTPLPVASALTIQYSKNGGAWTNLTSSTGNSAPTINVVSGDIVQFRGDNATYNVYNEETETEGVNVFYSEEWINEEQILYNTTCGFNLKGNIMSLINSTGFSAMTALEEICTFNSLFLGCTGLTSANNLILPATTLTSSCYGSMFRGCTNLTTAPELPATTLARSCYARMFSRTNLTTAPELPATTLAQTCYNAMFEDCVNLNYIKCLATNISASRATSYWVNGVAASGTFVKNSSMSLWTTGVNGIPSNWTVQDA